MDQILFASPLYILRHEAEKDLFSVLENLKTAGFDGVEFLGFFGKSPKEIRQRLDMLSLKALGNHVPLREFSENPQKVIEDHQILGCEYLTIAWPDRKLRPGDEGFSKTIEEIACLSALCRENGITPLYHNHDFEFRTSPSIVDAVMDFGKNDGLCLEPDLGWMLFAGAAPAEYLKKYRDCSPVIHLKDVYAKDFSLAGDGTELGEEKARPEKGYFEFRPVGYGLLNLPKLMPFCLDCRPKWFVMDHDLAYERDSYDDLILSLNYTTHLLKINGIS